MEWAYGFRGVVAPSRLREGQLGVEELPGADGKLPLPDPIQTLPDELLGGDLARPNLAGRLGRREAV